MTDRRGRLCDQSIQHLLQYLSSDRLVHLSQENKHTPVKYNKNMQSIISNSYFWLFFNVKKCYLKAL